MTRENTNKKRLNGKDKRKKRDNKLGKLNKNRKGNVDSRKEQEYKLENKDGMTEKKK